MFIVERIIQLEFTSILYAIGVRCWVEINVFPIFSTIAFLPFLLEKIRSCNTHSAIHSAKTIILILRVHDLTFNLFVRKSFTEMYSQTSLLLKQFIYSWKVYFFEACCIFFNLISNIFSDINKVTLYLRLSRIEQFTRKLIEATLKQWSFCTWNVYRITLSFCLESDCSMLSMVGVHFVGR